MNYKELRRYVRMARRHRIEGWRSMEPEELKAAVDAHMAAVEMNRSERMLLKSGCFTKGALILFGVIMIFSILGNFTGDASTRMSVGDSLSGGICCLGILLGLGKLLDLAVSKSGLGEA